MVLVVGCAVAIVGVLLTVRLTSSKTPTTMPSPYEVHELLLANEAINLPINATLVTELTEELADGGYTEETLLRNNQEILAVKRLGLANIEFTKVQIAPDCYRYDEVYRHAPILGLGLDTMRVRKPDGKFEQCDDMWKYDTTVSLRNPDTVDPESIAAKVSSLSDVGLTRSDNAGKRTASSTTVTIGSIEILEVSDVVTTAEGTYTVGFKCRFKPNSLGLVFDVSSPVFKSMPEQVRKLFVDSLTVTFDKRLEYLNASHYVLNKNTGRFSGGGIAVGHAELVKGYSAVPEWRVANVFFDQKDQTNYTFHPVN